MKKVSEDDLEPAVKLLIYELQEQRHKLQKEVDRLKLKLKYKRKVENYQCPKCKADTVDAEYGDFDPVESGDIEQRVLCTACGQQWVDVFSLTDVRLLYSE